MSTFDPLHSTANVFGGDDEPPPWPTTPHPPGSPVPNLRPALSPKPPAIPDDGPSPGLYGREAQIYGQPETGLISPTTTVATNGNKYEKPEPYLKTNLSNFTGTTYRNVSRSYMEFQQFYEAIMLANPHTIIPALPLAQTSAPTDEEDDRLVKIMLQRWITRVCEDPILIQDEDLRSFIEGDFGYQPIPRPRRKTSSGFSLIRRGVPDEDEELQRARFELTKLEGQFFETAKAVDRLALARKALANVHIEMGNKLINVATTESHPPLGNALRKLGRTWHSVADLDQAQAISECVILGDSLGYQGMNARSAKETLQMRTGVLEEYQAAVKTTISKRRQIERLQASSNIRKERVDEALDEMNEADKYEQVLAKRADGISQNLHRALQTHNRYVHDDITTALIEHARSSIMYERQLLRELEALRVDVSTAANKVLPPSSVPRPQIIPPLEEYEQPRSAPPGPPPNGSQRLPPPPGPSGPPVPGQPPNRGPLHHQGPHSAFSSRSFASQQQQQPHPITTSVGSTPPIRSPLSPQSPVAGPSNSPAPTQTSFKPPLVSAEPPLGGRFVDGTKSMFIKPSASSRTPPIPASSSTNALPPPHNPLGPQPPLPAQPRGVVGTTQGDPLLRPSSAAASYDPLSRSNGHPLSASQQQQQQQQQQGPLGAFDPLGQTRLGMASSVRVQGPARPRLDAREAASKLANMF